MPKKTHISIFKQHFCSQQNLHLLKLLWAKIFFFPLGKGQGTADGLTTLTCPKWVRQKQNPGFLTPQFRLKQVSCYVEGAAVLSDIKLFFCRGKKTWLKIQSVSEELRTLFSWELTPEVNPDQGLPLWHLTPHPQTCQEWQTRSWRQGCAGAGGEHEKSWQDWGGSGQTAEGNRATNRENSWALSPYGNLPRYCQSFWFFKKNKFIQWVLYLGTIECVCIYIYIYIKSICTWIMLNPQTYGLC